MGLSQSFESQSLGSGFSFLVAPNRRLALLIGTDPEAVLPP